MKRGASRRGLISILLVLLVTAGGLLVSAPSRHRTHVAAYFDNANGLFVGDDVRILGVRVGEVESIEAQPDRVKIGFWFDAKYAVPADANAVILSPSLITARAVQLTPAYSGGARLASDTVIPQSRTAVPVEWDDLRVQLQKLVDTLQPTAPGTPSTLGGLISTAAANLRGQGPSIHDSVVKLAQVFSTLGDHSSDVFGSVRNLSVLVSGLQSSTELMEQLNANLAAVTGTLAEDPRAIARAVTDLDGAITDVRGFAADNREALGITVDKGADLTKALADDMDDVKQFLHVAPNTLANAYNQYHPALGSEYGILALNNFADPVSFICGAIQAASRLGAAQAAKLCVQYLAPIVKNREYNTLPLGQNMLVGPMARPNELSYSENRLRPDFVPPAAPPPPLPAEAPPDASVGPAPVASPALAENSVATDPAAGLPGLMAPAGTP